MSNVASSKAAKIGLVDKKSPSEKFKERESKELVISFSGPIGSGVNLVIDETEKILTGNNYNVFRIKLSDFIKKYYANDEEGKGHLGDPKTRYSYLQTKGNELRLRYGNDILAELAVAKISIQRTTSHKNDDVKDIIPDRTAYLIDQLKHPAEVNLLRTVYGNLFYLVGVLASYSQRKKRLIDEHVQESFAEVIMERDRSEDIEHGQQLDKSLKLADLFIRNSYSHRPAIIKQIERFLKLSHGENGITPTQHEYAMYVAYSAGLKSACLSRLVGAAITDKHGNIIATGCNDVPRACGGLYTEKDQDKDYRCVNLEGGKCFNTHYKDGLMKEVESILREETGIDATKAIKLARKIRMDTSMKDLIEFSRSVHAEMDALTSIAREGGVSVQDGYLYSTTYPCHNCARHIIASGIRKVFYIEPYEKSLALKLHSDAMEIDPEEDNESVEKVQFLHFEGISPRQYQNFFNPVNERKDNNGKAIFSSISKSPKIIPEYLDSYKDLESKVTAHLHDDLQIDQNLY